MITPEQIEALCQKWIAEERSWRRKIKLAQTGEAFGSRMARSDTLAKCRRELQECANLVVKSEDL